MTKMIIVFFRAQYRPLKFKLLLYFERGNTNLIKLIEKMDKPNRETTIMQLHIVPTYY